jgi:hypothetical protein
LNFPKNGGGLNGSAQHCSFSGKFASVIQAEIAAAIQTTPDPRPPSPPRLLRPATGLGLLVLLLERLKPLLERDDLLIQLWQCDGSNRPPSGGKFAGGLGPISNIC